MVAAGGICEFASHTAPSEHRGAQISPASARASDELLLRPELSEGLPMPREPAYAAERSHDGEAKAASE
jgi:uncharacterized protein YbbK (DUF523 family)